MPNTLTLPMRKQDVLIWCSTIDRDSHSAVTAVYWDKHGLCMGTITSQLMLGTHHKIIGLIWGRFPPSDNPR